MISRIYKLEDLIRKQKALVLYGARRVGKTTLLSDFLNRTDLKYKLDSGDNIRTQEVFNSQDFKQILEYASGYDIIAIDEAQQIQNIGMGLKILVDQMPGIMVIVTGSSSFELSQQVGEPLTGRKKTLTLFPFSQSELLSKYNKFELREHLSEFLVFGSYPEVVLEPDIKKKIEILRELAESYLLKDILSLDKIRNSRPILSLLKLIAFQTGSQVSLNELAMQIGIDAKTVDRYLYLLENAFVIKKLGGYSRNLRNEVTSKAKYYFWDNGIRNAVIAQFNKIEDRNDIGILFENFIITERLKANVYNNRYCTEYFWRTYSGQEIDLIEEQDGKLHGYEFKWSEKVKAKRPSQWSYENSDYQVINKKNYLDFVL